MQALQHHDELITAQPGHRIRGAHAAGQSLTRLHQQPVTPFVPQGVVDTLEVVQVQKQQGPMGRTALAGGGSSFQAFEQQAPIGQACQVVVERQSFDFRLDSLALGNVTCQTTVP